MSFTERPAFIDDVAHAQLLANGHRTAGGEEIDPRPVIKLFTPDAGAIWLLTEINPDDEDLAFGLCDLGLACAAAPSTSAIVGSRQRGSSFFTPRLRWHAAQAGGRAN